MMDFTNNSLIGNLPPENMCQHLPALQELYMSGNKLTGRIPNNLWQCSNLQIVSLSYNQFEGSIPRDIGNLTLINQLFLGSNNLIGTIQAFLFDIYLNFLLPIFYGVRKKCYT